jgi:4-hydroxybenzoate polyprenyltransferase
MKMLKQSHSLRLFVSLLEAAHIAPGLVVTGISLALSAQISSIGPSALFAITILTGQFVVGWSNDLIDMASDKKSNRLEKPLVSGAVKKQTLQLISYYYSFSLSLGRLE